MSEEQKPRVTVMETRPDGRRFGWLGVTCKDCKGCGMRYSEAYDVDKPCGGCGGTGEAYGEIKDA